MLIDFIKSFWTLVLVVGTHLDLDEHRLLNREIEKSSSNIKIDSFKVKTGKISLSSSDSDKKYKDKSFSLAAVGDLMMGTNFPSKKYLPPNNGDALWTEAGPLLKSSDVTFGNLEGVILSEGGEMKECQNLKIVIYSGP